MTNEDKKIIIPQRFVGLHGHSGFSTYDGLGYPKEHMQYVLDNGMDAWALTDHGQMNGYAHAHMFKCDLDKSGRNLKFLPGVEFYVHPDIAQWRIDYAAAMERKKSLTTRGPDDEQDDQGSVIENEEASKQTKWFNPVNRRHHLVVLAKTQRGLKNLFTLVSRSYSEGYYRFPRIDYAMLKEHGQDLVVSTACLGGPISFGVLSSYHDVLWDDILPNLGDANHFETVQRQLIETTGRIQECVGVENFFLELQFNRLGAQHLVNQHIIALSRKLNIPLIATADSHYPQPGLWKDRELYKKLGWLSYDKYEPGLLPQSTEELKAELYPKNATQMWESYKDSVEHFSDRVSDWSFYDDAEISAAIERTYDIAHDLIDDPSPDTSIKLPMFVVPKDIKTNEYMDPYTALAQAVITGLRRKGFDKDPIYVARAKEELEVIRVKDFSLYFLTMKEIMDIARNDMLVGCGRGSAAGSLVCYLLDITQVDPIQYELLFSRFVSLSRDELPDIDSDVSDNDKLKGLLRDKFGVENVIPVSNYNSLALKSLIKDVSRFYSIPFDETNIVTRQVESDVRKAVIKPGDDKNVFVLSYDDAMKHSPVFRAYIEKYPHIGDHIVNLFKQNKSIGRHAGGVIIAEDIQRQMPVIKVRGEYQTAWTEGLNFRMLHGLGFIKFDLLGLTTLRIIERCIALIIEKDRKAHGGLLTIQLGDVELKLYGDQTVITANRGQIIAKEITLNDDIIEVPGMWP